MAGDFFLDDIDLGSVQPIPAPKTGLELRRAAVYGSRPIVLPSGAAAVAHSIVAEVAPAAAIGGAAAGSAQAIIYLLKQLEEASSNPSDAHYIRWGGSVLHNGWYLVNDCQPDYSTVGVGWARVAMDVIYLGPAANGQAAVWYGGGMLSTTYSGAGVPMVAFPVGSTGIAATSITRTGADGAIPIAYNPASGLNPLWYRRDTTIGNWFKGRVRVFDSITAGANPPPTDGTAWNTNWVEVYGIEHEFQGDMIVTNGLHLYVFNLGATRVLRAYIWNTALATASWQQTLDLAVYDTASNGGALVSLELVEVSARRAVVRPVLWTSGGKQEWFEIRLRRGRYHCHFDFSPLSEANSITNALQIVPANGLRLAYMSTGAGTGTISDIGVGATSLGIATDYGYVAAFTANAAQPFILGALSQGAVSKMAPTNGAVIGFGDTDGPAQNAVRTYGFFAIPYGVSGSYSTANLQAEAETGTLTGTAVSTADAGANASAGNAAKIPSGTAASGAVIRFGAAVLPAPGSYELWFRVRTGTVGAGTNGEMRFFLYDTVSGGTVGLGTASPSIFTNTSYKWIYFGLVFPPAGHAVQFQADNYNGFATTVDWYIDEAALLPVTLTADNRGPQELWQQFIQDVVEETAA